jgi:solute carrier family 35 (UDP-sugar transporter), member A1/2/3
MCHAAQRRNNGPESSPTRRLRAPRIGRMFAPEQAPYTCAASFFMTLQPILVSLSKNDRGGFDYSMPASTLLSEGLKLGISGSLLLSSCCQKRFSVLHEDSVTEFFSYMVPGLIYFLNNNMIFLILQAVDPTTFQLLSQMKTIFTGLLFRVFLNRRLSYVQWLALVTLACGTAVSQIPRATPKGMKAVGTYAFTGIGLSVLSSFLSACGGIYNEKVRPTTLLRSAKARRQRCRFGGRPFAHLPL